MDLWVPFYCIVVTKMFRALMWHLQGGENKNQSVIKICLNHSTYQTHYSIFLRRIPPWGWLKKVETCRRISTCLYIIVTNRIAVVGIYMVAQHLLWKSREHLVVSDIWWGNLVYHVMWQLFGVGLHHHSSFSSWWADIAPEPILSGETCTISTVSDAGTCCERVQITAFHSQHTSITSA